MLAEPAACTGVAVAWGVMDEALMAEVRELLTDMRGVSEDGRVLAARYADLLKGAVEGYCDELEQRADALLLKLGAST